MLAGMQRFLGTFLVTFGILLFGTFAVWSFVLCMGIVYHALGGFLTLIALIFLPFVFGLAPIYALFHGDLTPLAVTYGGTFIGGAFYMAGMYFKEKAPR